MTSTRRAHLVDALDRVPALGRAARRGELLTRYVLNQPVEREVAWCAREARAFLDVGANIGQSALAFGRVSRRGQVLCVEPAVACEPYLRDVRRLLGPRCRYVISAVGATPGTLTLHTPYVGSRSYLQEATTDVRALAEAVALGRLPAEHAVRTTQVPVTSVDAICAEHGLAPDLLKVDVQGTEADVLRGATAVLRAVRWVVVESSARHGGEVDELLRGSGFVPSVLVGGQLASREDAGSASSPNLVYRRP